MTGGLVQGFGFFKSWSQSHSHSHRHHDLTQNDSPTTALSIHLDINVPEGAYGAYAYAPDVGLRIALDYFCKGKKKKTIEVDKN